MHIPAPVHTLYFSVSIVHMQILCAALYLLLVHQYLFMDTVSDFIPAGMYLNFLIQTERPRERTENGLSANWVKVVISIDDIQHFVDVAESVGMQAILFKSAEQLKSDL